MGPCRFLIKGWSGIGATETHTSRGSIGGFAEVAGSDLDFVARVGQSLDTPQSPCCDPDPENSPQTVSCEFSPSLE